MKVEITKTSHFPSLPLCRSVWMNTTLLLFRIKISSTYLPWELLYDSFLDVFTIHWQVFKSTDARLKQLDWLSIFLWNSGYVLTISTRKGLVTTLVKVAFYDSYDIPIGILRKGPEKLPAAAQINSLLCSHFTIDYPFIHK